jgi:hypothetical protein
LVSRPGIRRRCRSRELTSILALAAISSSLFLATAAFQPAQAHDARTGEHLTFSWDNGDTFSGMVREGLPNGPGTITTRGRSYSGEWKDGCLTLPDGRRFALFTTLDKCSAWRRPRMPRLDLR